MTIIINGIQTRLPDSVYNIKDLAEWKAIPVQGTAVALNGKLVKAGDWEITPLNELDNLLIISAAYGG